MRLVFASLPYVVSRKALDQPVVCFDCFATTYGDRAALSAKNETFSVSFLQVRFLFHIFFADRSRCDSDSGQAELITLLTIFFFVLALLSDHPKGRPLTRLRAPRDRGDSVKDKFISKSK